MAWDISDYKLENLGPDPVPELNPEINWDEVARMVKAKQAKKAQAQKSETPQAPDTLAKQLRQLADKVQALEDRDN